MHRLRQVRDRVPARRDPDEGVRTRRDRRRPGELQDEVVPVARARRPSAHRAGRARRLHRLRRVRRRLPGEGQDRGQAQVDQHASRRGAPRRRARTLGLLRLDPRTRPHRDHPRLGQELPAARAALRVLGCVLGLRRDAVPQAAHPAVRRPPGDRQRHRLFVDLRRQPADDAVDGERRRAGPGVVELAVRGQRRVRARHAARHRAPPARGPPARRRAVARHRRRARARRCSPTPSRPKPTSTTQRDRVDQLRDAPARRSTTPVPARSTRSPTSSCARAPGSSVATAGPTTSASAASTTCSAAGATSTCSCSTPRCTPTPAGRRRRPRRSVRSPSSPPPARAPTRRTSAPSPDATATCTSPRWPSAAARSRPSRRCMEADAWDGPSLVIAYSTCIAHGIDMATSMSHQKEAVKSGYWPLYRYRPTAEEHEHPFQLDSAAPSIPLRDFALQEARYAMLARTDPERSDELLDLAQVGIDERWHYYEQLAAVERALPAIPHPDEMVRVEITPSWRRTAGRTTTEPRPTARRKGHTMPDLHTKYLGLSLRSPIVASAGPAHGRRRPDPRARDARGRCDRAAVAVRGADRARDQRDRPSVHPPRGQLRRGVVVLPRDRRVQHRRRARISTSSRRRRPPSTCRSSPA